MAQITDASLRETITERLQATHVEVTDMSGISTVLNSIPITNKVRVP
jgi:hypothetical protein